MVIVEPKSTLPTLLRIKIFHDEENSLIGLKPSEDGYKISKHDGSYRFKSALLAKIVTGKFFPKWSKKDKMLVFSI